jgi:glyoxalase-like protein
MTRKFDHLVLCAANLDRARAFYASIGFTLTPRALHPFGTANSLAQLQGNFLELLSVADAALIPKVEPGKFGFAAYNEAFLKKREGFSMLVFATSDAAADAAEFKKNRLSDYDVFHFGRQATLPDGSKAQVDFSLAFVTNPAMPEAVFFTCQQHAPQYFWWPEFQRHANGALRIAEVVMWAGRPDDHRSFLESLMQAPARLSPAGLSIGEGDECLTVLNPSGLADRFPEIPRPGPGEAPRFAAYGIEVADLATVRTLLAAAGMAFRSTPRSLVLPPSAALGTAIEFRVPG